MIITHSFGVVYPLKNPNIVMSWLLRQWPMVNGIFMNPQSMQFVLEVWGSCLAELQLSPDIKNL